MLDSHNKLQEFNYRGNLDKRLINSQLESA